jgi:serine/threonine protein kinase
MNNQRTTRKQGGKRYRWVGTMRKPIKTRSERERNRSRRRREEKAGLMKFRDLRYLRSGENGNAYLMGNSKLLKLPRTGKLNPKEAMIHDALARLGLPYFPKLYEYGQVLTTMPYNDYRSLNKSTINSFGRGIGPYPYDFIVMEYIQGGMPIQDYIQTKYGGLFVDGREPTEEEKIRMMNDYVTIFGKIAFALYISWNVTNFLHTDLHEKNFLVKPDGTPIILDYGRSKVFTNQGKHRYRTQTLGTDLGSAIWYSLDSDNYTIPGLKLFVKNLKKVLFTDLRVGRTADSFEDTINKLVKLKTGMQQPFTYATSFQTLGVPDDIIVRGKTLLDNRQEVVRTAEKNAINTSNATTFYLGEPYGDPSLPAEIALPRIQRAFAAMELADIPPEGYTSDEALGIYFSTE